MSGNVTIPNDQYLQGMICDPSEYLLQSSLHSSAVHCLTRGQSIGLTIISESGFISLFAVLYVFYIIFGNAYRHARTTSGKDWRFIQEPMDVFMLSLFAADFLQALGAVLDIKWINEGVVEVGSFCTAQGVIQQLGETGVAITTMAIAVYTFVLLRWNLPDKVNHGHGIFVSVFVVTAIWLFILVMVIAGNVINGSELYQQPTPYWCWIGGQYQGMRIAGEYAWFWITLGVSLILYVTLFLWSMGNVNFSATSWWKMAVLRRPNNTEDFAKRGKPWDMLAYPIVYSILILPLSIVRWITFNSDSALSGASTSAVTMVVLSIYGLSGFFSVLLLLLTRPDTLLFGRAVPTPVRGRAPSLHHEPSSNVEVYPVHDTIQRGPRLPSLLGADSQHSLQSVSSV
ncbi:hypothetical protein CPB85DRAFT_413173 [Mucidula mucida]|nr:hypothetical protein CPB85DRAFT_413173 [Mucidula mucida]